MKLEKIEKQVERKIEEKNVQGKMWFFLIGLLIGSLAGAGMAAIQYDEQVSLTKQIASELGITEFQAKGSFGAKSLHDLLYYRPDLSKLSTLKTTETKVMQLGIVYAEPLIGKVSVAFTDVNNGANFAVFENEQLIKTCNNVYMMQYCKVSNKLNLQLTNMTNTGAVVVFRLPSLAGVALPTK